MPYKIVYNIIFLPMIAYVAYFTGMEDLKTSKIRNKWVLIGLSYSFIIYLAAWVLLILGKKGLINFNFIWITPYLLWNFEKWCINLAVSIFVAYLIWHFKLWGAGDAKLFICYSALFPMGQYSKVYFGYYFASCLLLLSIFIPPTIFIFLKSSIFVIKKSDFNKIKEKLPGLIRGNLNKLKIIELIKVLSGFFVFFFVFKIAGNLISNLVNNAWATQILMLISLAAFRQLSKIFKKNIKFIFAAFVFLILYSKMIFTWEQLFSQIQNTFISSLAVMILYPIIKKTVGLYSDGSARKTIPFAFWMFLGVLIAWFI